MRGKRTDKIARQIQRDLSEIFNLLSSRYFENAFITVMEVRVSADLGVAKVYLGIMNSTKKNETFGLIEFYNPQIRKMLGEKMRNQLRKIPVLQFFLDTTLDQAEHIEKLLNKIKNESQ
ncbi:MAG: 30S ribosome-binding factor RbfA [Bacteroidetes bacterium]|nr:30S ribosome-binding factor RbfA [Bacteroidota bacterium]